MRYLILSDLHANLEAASSALADARAQGFDRSVVLGDLVGYGASPNEVIDLIRDLQPAVVVRGNHDKAACDLSEAAAFNEVAREAVEWTRATLTRTSQQYLRGLPCGPLDPGGFLLAHGSPLDEDDYILWEVDASRVFDGVLFDVCFFGHTHFACAFALHQERCRLLMFGQEGAILPLEPGRRYLINPGSIGQPRDHNARAAYAIFDTRARRLQARRVAYDVASAQARIRAAGLPRVLAERLALGV